MVTKEYILNMSRICINDINRKYTVGLYLVVDTSSKYTLIKICSNVYIDYEYIVGWERDNLYWDNKIWKSKLEIDPHLTGLEQEVIKLMEYTLD